MSLIESLQKKSPEQKMRIIWATVIVAFILLMVLWILTTRIGKKMPTDTTMFKAIGQGVEDVKNNYQNNAGK